MTPEQLERVPHRRYVQLRDTYLDHFDYEAEAIDKARSGEDEDDPTQKALNDAPWEAETVIVPMA